MAEPDDEIANRADAAASQAGLSGDVSSVTATCPKTELEIGVFFDGTGNNETNALIGGNGGGSYGNARSNIALLKALYRDGPSYNIVNENGTGVCRKFKMIYMSGIGTSDSESDSTFGKATGTGSTGVWQIVHTAIERMGEYVNMASVVTPPEKIIVDVFGFSRGAAAARHFVNAVRGKFSEYLNAGTAASAARMANSYTFLLLKHHKNIQFRFIGVFDTVASIVLGKVEYNFGVNVHLKEEQAEKIFHLTAANEYRENFRLNHNLPGGGDHYEMPGAHSDVGGGYRDEGDKTPVGESETFESPDRGMIEYLHDLQTAEIARMNAKYREQALLDGFVNPDQAGAISYTVSPIREMEYPGTFGGTMMVYAFDVKVISDRPWVRLGLSRVAMATMYWQALAQKVPFLSLPSGGEYEIPADLQTIAQKTISLAPLSAEEKQFVVSNYAHISANPDSIGMSRERKKIRTVYANNTGYAI